MTDRISVDNSRFRSYTFNVMEKKITIKDIAREAGVSVATVSYVLNDRQDQKISESTRNRVLHIVNMMGYTGSRSARTLVTGKTGCIAVCTFARTCTILQAEQMSFLRILSRVLYAGGYNTVYVCADKPGRLENVDAVVCIGASEEKFRELSQHNFVPVISLDMVVNDNLFYQINFDYVMMLKKAQNEFGFDFCVVANETENKLLHKRIADVCGSDVYFCEKARDLVAFLKRNGKRPLAVCSEYAYDICLANGANAMLIAPDYEKLAQTTLEQIRLTLLRKAGTRHDILVF